MVTIWPLAGLSVRGLSFLEGFFGYFRIILCTALAVFLLLIKCEKSKSAMKRVRNLTDCHSLNYFYRRGSPRI